MAHRIEIIPTVADARAHVRKRQLESTGFAGKVRDVQLVDVYTIDAPLQEHDLHTVGRRLADTVTQQTSVDIPQAPEHFDWAVEIGYHPGVTDNVAAVSDAHQNRLKEAGDWIIFPRTLEHLADGRYSQDEQGNLYFDGQPIPHGLSIGVDNDN